MTSMGDANSIVASVSFIAVGALHHTIGRHCGAITRRQLEVIWGTNDDINANDIIERA
jgi:hypothetical protein